MHHIAGVRQSARFAPLKMIGDLMHEPLPDGGSVRKLWLGESDVYAEHLLRLDPDSRRRRFSGAVSDDLIRQHAASAQGIGVVIYGFFVDGVLRGSAELRVYHPQLSREA